MFDSFLFTICLSQNTHIVSMIYVCVNASITKLDRTGVTRLIAGSVSPAAGLACPYDMTIVGV